MTETTTQEFFESKYQESADPWSFATEAYELQRYDAIMAALNEKRYARAWEPGCSVGVLTERLAEVCDQVEASDISETAVKRARERCAAKPNVTVRQGSFAESMPKGCDLLMLCEIGYYFTEDDLREVMHRAIATLSPGATMVACHWLGQSDDHIISGDQVHEVLRALPELRLELGERHEGFRIDRWRTLETKA